MNSSPQNPTPTPTPTPPTMTLDHGIPSQSTSSPSATHCLKCRLNQPVSPSPWIHCALCSSPWHWTCVTTNQLDPIELIEKWFCVNCVQRDPDLRPIYKEPPRKSSRVKPRKTSYADLSADPEADPDRFIELASSKKNVIDGFEATGSGPHKPFRKMKASELTMEWLTGSGQAMTEPVVIDDPAGLFELGMRMPSPDLTITEIAALVGPETPVEVIDVASQAELSRWTLGQWAHYYHHPKRDRVRNVISLEVSETPLGHLVQLPKIVTDMDWVQTVWPSNLRAHGSGSYPKVQKYCLMSVARCWTDWHIDFAGSSVFYHILRGAKTFYFIRPTVANLAKYEKWSGSSKLQQTTWLGDQVNVVYSVRLRAGQTMMIPTGWIHAVHTPEDSLVFGGNFLHSLNIPVQLRVHQIENATKVPKKFRFPFFIPILWFVLLHYLQTLEAPEPAESAAPAHLDAAWPIPPRIAAGLAGLAEFLLGQTAPSEAHPALTCGELRAYLEAQLHTERLSNLRQTVLKFQAALGARCGPVSSADLGQDPAPHLAEKPPSTYRSPLQITIKRKCTPGGEPKAEDTRPTKPAKARKAAGAKEEEPKKRKPKPAADPKRKPPPTASPPAAPHGLSGGQIVAMVHPAPTNEVRLERRKRPRFDDEQGSPDPSTDHPAPSVLIAPLDPPDAPPLLSPHAPQDPALDLNPAPPTGPVDADAEVEVRTTRAYNSVVRKWFDRSKNKVVYETRTVQTTIEKVYFDQ